MKHFLTFALFALGLNAAAQTDGDGVCCDPDMSDFDPGWCAGVFSPTNCVNDEPADCIGTIDDPACIPLDGGLSLLAIAGGGLATAAMRRRREEELLEKEA